MGGVPSPRHDAPNLLSQSQRPRRTTPFLPCSAFILSLSETTLARGVVCRRVRARRYVTAGSSRRLQETEMQAVYARGRRHA